MHFNVTGGQEPAVMPEYIRCKVSNFLCNAHEKHEKHSLNYLL